MFHRQFIKVTQTCLVRNIGLAIKITVRAGSLTNLTRDILQRCLSHCNALTSRKKAHNKTSRGK